MLCRALQDGQPQAVREQKGYLSSVLEKHENRSLGWYKSRREAGGGEPWDQHQLIDRVM